MDRSGKDEELLKAAAALLPYRGYLLAGTPDNEQANADLLEALEELAIVINKRRSAE